MRTCWLVLILMFCSLAAAAQEPSANFQALNKKYSEQYKSEQYKPAIETLKKLLALPETKSLPGAQGTLLFNRACIYALLNDKKHALADLRAAVEAGYTKYGSYAYDRDLDSLRSEPDFESFLAQLREKYGTKPLEWDTSQPAPAFAQKFDVPATPGLAQLRSEFHLDPVVVGSKTDYDALVRLTLWTSKQWEHSNNQMASKPDPITILREAKAGGKFICRDYAIVLAGAARAFDLYARTLAILPKDVETRSEAHSVAEVWLPQFKKWVLADGQYGIVPELKGIPLNAVELQKAIADDAPLYCRGNNAKCAEWKEFILPNLYYFKIGDDQRRFGGKSDKQLVLMPKGATEPHKFAGGNAEVFAGSVYTSNPASFYAPPATGGS